MVTRSAMLAVTALSVGLAAGPHSADAGSRRTGLVIGGAILGAIVLHELGQHRSAAASSEARKAGTSKSKVATRRSSSGAARAQAQRVPEAGSRPKTEPSKNAEPDSGGDRPTQQATTPASPIETAAIPGPAAPARAGAGQTISTPAEIKSAQEHLEYLGYDVAPTGAIDLQTRIASMRFQESIGAPTTGVLTVEQLQALFLKAATKTAMRQ